MKIEKIVLIGFNRSELLIQNYKYIRAYYRGVIDLYIDGARENNRKDIEEQNVIKDFFEKTNDYNLIRNYSEINRGCRNGVIHAISESFKNARNCIIIEDDCFVSPTFFSCFDFFLHKKESGLVMSSKCLFHSDENLQYYFNHSIQVWGWGCTKDVWDKFLNTNTDDYIKFWKNDFKGNFFFKWNNIVKTLISEKIDTWDYSFKSFLISQNLKVISFNKNMVDNRGVDSGTHKTYQNKVPFFIESIDPTKMELNQNLLKEFEKEDFLSSKGLLSGFINFILYQMGKVRVGKKIESLHNL